jgi:hypothetical protein
MIHMIGILTRIGGCVKTLIATALLTPDIPDVDWEKLKLESAYVKKRRLKPVVSEAKR